MCVCFASCSRILLMNPTHSYTHSYTNAPYNPIYERIEHNELHTEFRYFIRFSRFCNLNGFCIDKRMTKFIVCVYFILNRLNSLVFFSLFLAFFSPSFSVSESITYASKNVGNVLKCLDIQFVCFPCIEPYRISNFR